MIKVRTLTLCLTAALAFAAFGGVSAAYAKEKLPAWGECVPVETHEGHYGDPNCIVPAKKVFGTYNGGYEWQPLVKGESGNVGADLPNSSEEPEPATITFADGYQITCDGEFETERSLPLLEARLTTAPWFVFAGCVDTEGGECRTTGAAGFGEIDTEKPFFDGARKEPGGWVGQPEFISGKKGPSPAVGIVYRAEEERGRMFQQVVCEGEAVHAFVIGGLNKKEQLTAQIKPVNTMAEEFTVTLSQSNGVQGPETLEGRATKPLEALVNGETWETVGIEIAETLPGGRFGVVNIERPNDVHTGEVELKATP